MELGEMIKIENFTLHDAMSGTELCDPKMDVKKNLDQADTPEKLIKEGKLKPAN